MKFFRKLFMFNFTQVVVYIVVLLAITLFFLSTFNKQTYTTVSYDEVTTQIAKIKPVFLDERYVNTNILLYEDTSKNIIAVQIKLRIDHLLNIYSLEFLNILSKLLIYKTNEMGNHNLKQFLEDNSINMYSELESDSININIVGLTHYKDSIFLLVREIIRNNDYSIEDLQNVTRLIKQYNASEKNIDNIINSILQKTDSNIYMKNEFMVQDFIMVKNDIFTKSNMYLAFSGNLTQEDIINELAIIINSLAHYNNHSNITYRFFDDEISDGEVYSVKSNEKEEQTVLLIPWVFINAPNYPYLYLIRLLISDSYSNLDDSDIEGLNDYNNFIYYNNYYDDLLVLQFIGRELNTYKIKDVVFSNIENLSKGGYSMSKVENILNEFLFSYLEKSFINSISIARTMNKIQFYWKDTDAFLNFINQMHSAKKTDITKNVSYIDTDKIIIIRIYN